MTSFARKKKGIQEIDISVTVTKKVTIPVWKISSDDDAVVRWNKERNCFEYSYSEHDNDDHNWESFDWSAFFEDESRASQLENLRMLLMLIDPPKATKK